MADKEFAPYVHISLKFFIVHLKKIVTKAVFTTAFFINQNLKT